MFIRATATLTVPCVDLASTTLDVMAATIHGADIGAK
jgi:hypothetical protein